MAKLAICEMTISPEVDISVIITNISQKIGVFSIAMVLVPGPGACPASSCVMAGGAFSPSAARNPTAPNTAPYCSSVAW